MRLPRLSISGAMAVIVLIAVEFAAIRTALEEERSRAIRITAITCLIMVITAQIGLVLTVCSKSRTRGFWFGFTVTGVFAALLLTANTLWFHSRVLRFYFVAVQAYFEGHPILFDIVTRTYARYVLIAASVAFVPELVVALVGGLIVMGLGGKRVGPSRGPCRSGRAGTVQDPK